MKLVKLSVAAAMLMGASAYAEVKNVSFYGDAKVWYQTQKDKANDNSKLFAQGNSDDATVGNSRAQVSLVVGLKADVAEGMKLTVEGTGVDTLGLENNLVSGVPTSSLTAEYVSLANIAYTAGKTTAIIGRQELNTPLAFTENWNVARNTFGAAVVANSDIPDTTIVGAWVGQSNGATGIETMAYNSAVGDATIAANGAYSTFMDKGAYALAIVNSSVKDTALQGWYYSVSNIANAYWLQADAKIDIVTLGAQYANMKPQGSLKAYESTHVWALKAGVDVEGVNAFAAYSQVNDKNGLDFGNLDGSATKIYTGDDQDSIYAKELVVTPGAKAWKIGAGYTVVGVNLKANYTQWKDTDLGVKLGTQRVWDLMASGDIAGINLKGIYSQARFSDDYKADAASEGAPIHNANAMRIVATLPF